MCINSPGSGQKEVSAIFRRLVVFLDELAPQQGVFPLALDWARRFCLPICGVPDAGPTSAIAVAGERRCEEINVAWEAAYPYGRELRDLRLIIRPGDLLIFGRALRSARRGEFFDELLRTDTVPVLFGSDASSLPSRVLLVDQGEHSSEQFIAAGGDICSSLGANLIVLTLARSDRLAHRREEATRNLLATRGINADFDFMVGREPRAAIASVARWRRCSLVIVEQKSVHPWWRWFRSGGNGWLAKFTEPLSFLSFPGTAIPFLPTYRRDATPMHGFEPPHVATSERNTLDSTQAR